MDEGGEVRRERGKEGERGRSFSKDRDSVWNYRGSYVLSFLFLSSSFLVGNDVGVFCPR